MVYFYINSLFRQIAFYAGSILAVLIILTVFDEDVLNVEHVIPTMAVLGVVIAVCRACIPNEVCQIGLNYICIFMFTNLSTHLMHLHNLRYVNCACCDRFLCVEIYFRDCFKIYMYWCYAFYL